MLPREILEKKDVLHALTKEGELHQVRAEHTTKVSAKRLLHFLLDSLSLSQTAEEKELEISLSNTREIFRAQEQVAQLLTFLESILPYVLTRGKFRRNDEQALLVQLEQLVEKYITRLQQCASQLDRLSEGFSHQREEKNMAATTRLHSKTRGIVERFRLLKAGQILGLMAVLLGAPVSVDAQEETVSSVQVTSLEQRRNPSEQASFTFPSVQRYLDSLEQALRLENFQDIEPNPTPIPQGLEIVMTNPEAQRVAMAEVSTNAPAAVALTTEQAEQLFSLQENVEKEIGRREIAISIERYSPKGVLEYKVAHNETERYPVASTFKLFVGLYYFMNTPESAWESQEGTDVYRMIVFSNNTATGNVLADVATRIPGEENPIVKFNNFLQGIGMREGLYRWNDGALQQPQGAELTDERFAIDEERYVDIRGFKPEAHNIWTVEDLQKGLRYIALAEHQSKWQEDAHFRNAILASRSLLSIPAPGYKTPIESVLYTFDQYGKDGYLTPEDIGIFAASESVVMNQPDGGLLLISFESAGESVDVLRGFLGNTIHRITMFEQERSGVTGRVFSSAENAEYLQMGKFNYGYVIPQRIELFSQPNEEAVRIENNYREYMTLPNAYLMQGALVRILPIDEEWGEVVFDDIHDAAFQRQKVYVRVNDLELVNLRETTEPIEYVDSKEEGHQKTVVIDMHTREMTLFEGGTAVLKTPIVLNNQLTETGVFFITRRYLSRNMPGYPGVPYSSFFDGPRAIHGSPWQHWTDTVQQGTEKVRSSGGCINVPDWLISVGEYENIRTDEFVFRWLGSNTRADEEAVELQSGDPIYVYVVDSAEDLSQYRMPDTNKQLELSWGDFQQEIKEKSLDVPDDFSQQFEQGTTTIERREWEEVPLQSVAYGQVDVAAARMFIAPDFSSSVISNPVIDLATGLGEIVAERRLLPKGGVVRVEVLDDTWARLLVDEGTLTPYGDRHQEVFIPLADLMPLHELEPITLNETTRNQDKMIVILRQRNPELLLLEGSKIVMRIPVFLGGEFGESTTPTGDYRVSRIRASSDMPGFPAVGFALYFDTVNGYAIHDGYSFNWQNAEQGGYGTAGCVNIPNETWRSIQYEGESLSPSEFIFRWSLSNIPYDPAKESEVVVPSTDAGFLSGESTVRVVSVDSIHALPAFTPTGSTEWEQVIAQYETLTGKEWILPQR